MRGLIPLIAGFKRVVCYRYFLTDLIVHCYEIGDSTCMLSKSYFIVAVYLHDKMIWDSLYWGKDIDSNRDEKADLGVLNIW